MKKVFFYKNIWKVTYTHSCPWKSASLYGLFQTLPVIANEPEDLDLLVEVDLNPAGRYRSPGAGLNLFKAFLSYLIPFVSSHFYVYLQLLWCRICFIEISLVVTGDVQDLLAAQSNFCSVPRDNVCSV